MRSLFLACLLLGVGGFPLVAQDVSTMRPKEPLTLRAPDGLAWKITTRYKERGAQTSEEDGSAPTTIVREGRKAGRLIYETVRYGSTIYQNFVIGPLVVTDYGKKGYAVTVNPDNKRFFFYDACDFDRMRWVDLSNFRGVEEKDGKNVFSFSVSEAEKKLNPAQQSQYDYWKSKQDYRKPAFASDSIAYLDVTTQLPVFYSDDEVEESYEFFPAPSTEVVIPQEIQEEIRSKIRYLEAAAAGSN